MKKQLFTIKNFLLAISHRLKYFSAIETLNYCAMKKLFFLLLLTILLSACSSVVNFFESAERLVDTGYYVIQNTEYKWHPSKKESPPKADFKTTRDSI